MVYLVFILLWILTFWPSWYLLIKLIALSTADKLKSAQFSLVFVAYRLLLALPYLYLVIAGGETVNNLVRSLALGAIGLGLCMSILRFFFSGYVNSTLWFVYGYVYDGLRHFYPYIHLQELVFKEAKPDKNDKILDLGAGSGNQTILLAQSGCEVVAVDSSKSMLARLKKKVLKQQLTNVRVVESDLMAYLSSEKAHQFDTVVMVNVLYTVTDRTEFWRQLFRVLKKDGKVVITNSDKGGNGSLIKEHIDHRGMFSLFRPSLIGVFVVDSLISEMAKTGHFNFVQAELLEKEIEAAGGAYRYICRCYGGVNILFEITR